MPVKQGSVIKKSGRVFGQRQKTPKMVRAGLYARVSTQDQQTLPMQNRAMREYAARRGWTIAMQVKEVGSGAIQRQLRERLLEASLGKIGHRSARYTSGTAASRRRVRIADRGAGPDHSGGSCNAALLAVFAGFEREILGERVRAGLAYARQNVGPTLNRWTPCRPDP